MKSVTDVGMSMFATTDWISVNDRLPDPDKYDWVLVSIICTENKSFRLVPHVAELRNGKWVSQDDIEGDLETWAHVKVTHWMPLPDNPIEDVNEQ